MTPKEYFQTHRFEENSDSVFVLLGKGSKNVYDTCIHPVVEESLLLQCSSYLDIIESGDAVERIWEQIQKASMLIFDLTKFPSSVMYELGVVLTFREVGDVVLIRERDGTPLPFNIRHLQVYYYSRDDLEALKNTLHKNLYTILRRKFKLNTSPVSNPDARKIMNRAIECRKAEDWTVANALFADADSKEPNNWYILNQWGILYRDRQEYTKAEEKFKQAHNMAIYPEDKAYILIELAILYDLLENVEDAEIHFRRSEKAYKNNKDLYREWAKFYEKHGHYEEALDKITFLRTTIDATDEAINLRASYYQEKLNNPDFGESFDEYVRRHVDVISEQPQEIEIAWDISWEDMQKVSRGTIITGRVCQITGSAIEVKLSREFTGSIPTAHLPVNYGETFFRNQPLKVKIEHFTAEKGIELRLAGKSIIS